MKTKNDGCINSNDQDSLWSYFQKDYGRFEVTRPRQEYIARYIPEGCISLNIGIGGATILEQILLKKRVDVYIVDIDEDTVNRISQSLQLQNKAKVGRIEQIPIDESSFDRVICSEVLEHLNGELLEKGLSECFSVLKRGGKLIGTVPARENLMSSLVYCPKCKTQFHPLGHCRSFDAKSLEEILSKKFKVERIQKKLFIYSKNFNLKQKTFLYLKKLHMALGGVSSASNFFFIAEK